MKQDLRGIKDRVSEIGIGWVAFTRETGVSIPTCDKANAGERVRPVKYVKIRDTFKRLKYEYTKATRRFDTQRAG